MLGSQDIPGILPCAIRDVFNGIKGVSMILDLYVDLGSREQ